MITGEQPGWLSYADVERVLGLLSPRLASLVLVGGQAVNYWASRYRADVPDLRPGPFTSKDVDFQGGRHVVEECASLLSGRFFLPEKDHVTPEAGKVVFETSDGTEREIDFLNTVYGLRDRDVSETAVPVPVGQHEIRILHPLLCMQSRVHNVVGLPGQYDNAHGLLQLRASIICLRAFVLEGLDAGWKPRRALEIYQKVFRFSKQARPRTLYKTHDFDTFEAVEPNHPALPDKVRTEWYPRCIEEMQLLRSR